MKDKCIYIYNKLLGISYIVSGTRFALRYFCIIAHCRNDFHKWYLEQDLLLGWCERQMNMLYNYKKLLGISCIVFRTGFAVQYLGIHILPKMDIMKCIAGESFHYQQQLSWRIRTTLQIIFLNKRHGCLFYQFIISDS